MELRRELILYATPTGDVAAQVDGYFATATEQLGATTAQTYPPHCTLTGFFRRTTAHADSIIETYHAQRERTTIDATDVRIEPLVTTDDWVGLQLTGDPLIAHATAFAEWQDDQPGDDAVRVKTWPHLSLAYGTLGDGTTLDDYAQLARDTIDITELCAWQLGLWERNPDGSWINHTFTTAHTEP